MAFVTWDIAGFYVNVPYGFFQTWQDILGKRGGVFAAVKQLWVKKCYDMISKVFSVLSKAASAEGIKTY